MNANTVRRIRTGHGFLAGLFVLLCALAAPSAEPQSQPGGANRGQPRQGQGDSRVGIDWNRARQLYERSQRGEKLTSDEQAYLNQAMAERQKQGGRVAAGQGPLKEPPRLVDYDPVPLPQAKLWAERPRIWFSKQDLPELRRRCQITHKSYLDAVVGRGIEDLGQPGIRAFNLAFAYQMTGEVKYARQAIELARGVKRFGWVKPNERSLPYGEWYAAHADPLACVFDWCFDQLSPDERKAIGGVLRDEIAFGPYRTRFHEPFWMAAWLSEILALYGAGVDDNLAEKALADYNRSIHQWTALADEIHADGAIGTYHYQYKDFFFFPEMWLRATGENLFEKCGFLRSQPMYELYSVMPDHRWFPSDGDGPVDALGTANRNWLYDIKLFQFYGWRNNNPYSRWFARHMQSWPNSNWECHWQAIVWADDGKEEKPLGELPPVRCFPDNGVVIMREGWDVSPTSKQILAAFYCRPFEGHAHCNFGDFVIWRGLDRLATRGGFYCDPKSAFHHNYFYRTVAHNCVLIDDPHEQIRGRQTEAANDGGQWPGDPQGYPISYRVQAGYAGCAYRGELGAFADEPRFTYVFADLTKAYNPAKAARVARAFLWLKPSTFVVCDWVKSQQPEFAKRWLLHTMNKPSVDGSEKVVAGSKDAGILESSDSHGAICREGGSKLLLQTLLPERPLLREIGGQRYAYWCDGKNWDPAATFRPLSADRQASDAVARRTWRIEIEPAEAAAETVFLNVFDATATEAAAPPPAALVKREKAVGLALQRNGGAREILFYPDGRASIDGKPAGQPVEPLRRPKASAESRRDAQRN